MTILRSLFCALALSFSALVWAAPIDINTADAQTIADNMKGVGLKKAQAIVAYRSSNGPYKSVDELVSVKGIGSKTLSRNRDAIMIGQPANSK
ncbi:MAG: helix-hairpin-helix domain-containing protein [Granulosicoccaceae bacterium]|jgi:competence protein ComEA